MIGQAISHYKITGKLGEGGMGVVYKARDTKLDRDVALKFLPESLTPTEEDRLRFIREAKSAAALNHPNICTIYSVDEHKDKQFIVMEFVDGENLRDIMDRGGVSPEKALDYGIQISKALAEAHKADIIHRDIKPENIMLDEKGRVKVLDFGLAKVKHDRDITKTGSTVGTLAYSSPEQVRGEEVGPRSDLFSLGVVLFEMLTGEKPFRGEHQAAMTYAIVNEEPDSIRDYLQDTPAKLEQFFEKALAKNSKERFGNAGKFIEGLEFLKEDTEIPEKSTRLSHTNRSSEDSSESNSNNGGSTTISVTIPSINLEKYVFERKGYILAVISILMLVFFSGWWIYSTEYSTVASEKNIIDRTIAVLPFANLSGSQKITSVARGLHGDLLTRLSNIGDLKVSSRTSVESYQNSDLSLPVIADSLGVQWIVEGDVQGAGELLQVNAQLIDPETDTNIWADSYRRELTAENLFNIQGEIAQEIARALQAELTESEQQRIAGTPTRNLDAYHLYVKGRKRLGELNFSDIQPAVEALELFQKAVEEDSNFALGWAGLADAAMYYGPSYWPDSAVVPKVSQREAAKHALELAPNLAEAHTSMALVHLNDGDGPKALQQLERAIELKPSYWEAHHRLGVFYLITGRVKQALDHLTLAVELNPEHAMARHGLYDAYLAAGNAEKSLKEVRRQQKLGLEEISAIAGEVRALHSLERYEKAVRITKEQIQQLDSLTGWGGWFRAYMVSILTHKGDTTQALKYLKEMRNGEEEEIPAKLGQAYAALGQIDRSFEAYNQLDEEGWRRFGPSIEFRYGIMYDLDKLMDDPRYDQLIQRANRAWNLNPDGSIPEVD